MNGDLERLRRLRALQGNRPQQTPSYRIPSADSLNQPGAFFPAAPSRARGGEPQPIEALLPGVRQETPFGAGYMIPTAHDSDYRHGGRLLTGWLDQSLDAAAEATVNGALAGIDARRCLFLDTETTGLLTGAGTLVFLVGVGFFSDRGFEVQQFFLRDPAEEPAMLDALRAVIAEHDALITFNGRLFDVPLLQSRYLINRQRVALEAMPNLDLLYPARKLWKRRLESCRLGHLEAEVLGVERTEQDVPGWYIPQLYQDYVVSKDARDITRVIYHNLMDVLSMVTLGTQLCETFIRPEQKALHGQDWLSLARWYESVGRASEAETAYKAALQAARLDEEMLNVVQHLTAFLRKQGRPEVAVPHLETWAALQPRAIEPRIELSKVYEWTTKDYAQALRWAEDALATARSWSASLYRDATAAEIEHRLDRLRRKAHV